MFKGKVYSYSNINWKEKKFEKEFDDVREYNHFIRSNPEFSNFSDLDKWISFDSMLDFNNYLEDFFNSKFILSEPKNSKVLESPNDSENIINWVDLSKYEKEVEKIEKEKKEKERKKWLLEKALEKLKWYLEKFKKENKQDLVKKIEEDIKKVEKDLKELI